MATGAPGTNGVWQYGEDDSEATFSALLNKAASTTDTQIGADRTRLTALEARKLSGVVPIVPTSVTPVSGSASVNSLGTVTFTSVSKIQLNGVFTGYTNYKILFRQTSGTAHELHARYMTSGTENSSSNYSVTGGESSGSSLSVFNQTGQNRARWAFIGNNADTIIEQAIANPSVSRTTVASHSVGSYNAGPWIQIYDNVFYATTVFDGISIYSNNGATFSGEVTVYGFNQ